MRKGMVFAMVFLVAFFPRKTDNHMGYAGVQRGKLSDASIKSLLTKLSSSALQPAAWGHLLHSHPLALKYFLVAGAPKGEQSSFSTQQYSYPAGLGTTLSACIADYENISIKQGIGKITVKACVLMFDCLDNECGALTPVVLVKDMITNSLKYATVWQRLPGSTSVINAAPAFVSPGITGYDESKFRRHFVKLDPCCSGEKIPFQVIRSISEASRGVVPFSCHALYSSIPVSDKMAYDFLLLRNLKKAYVLLNIAISRPLEECSKAPMLLQLDGLFRACVPSHFISNYICSSFSYSINDASFQKTNVSFLNAVISNLNIAYGYARQKNRIMSLLGPIRAGIGSNILILEGPLHLERSCMDTYKKEHAENMAELCYLGISKIEPDSYDSCAFCTGCMCQAAEVEMMELEVKLEQLTMSYIDEHTTLFNNDNGQAEDMFSVWALIVSVLIAIVGLSVPLQKYIHGWVQNKVVIYLLLSATYIIWIFSSALPLISFIKSDISRRSTYETWTLVPTDMMLNSHGKQVNLLLVFSGESIYEPRWWAIGVLVVMLTLVYTFKMVIVKPVCQSFDKEGDELKGENGKARKMQLKIVVISVGAVLKFKHSSLLAVDIVVA